MYSSSYDLADGMTGLFVGRRPDTLIGAPKEDQVQQQLQQQQLYANDPTVLQTPRHHLDHLEYTNLASTTMVHGRYRKRITTRQSGAFMVPDAIALRIFSYLETEDLLKISQVCKRFETLCWSSNDCWRVIHLRGELRGDKVLKMIFKRLLGGQLMDPSLPFIERFYASHGCKMTDKSLGVLSRRCPELTHLQIQSSSEIYDSGVTEILNKCTNLQHLDLTGMWVIVITSTGC